MNIQKFWNEIHNAGKVCLHCSFLKTTDSLFCQACENTLWERHQKNHSFKISESNLTGETLFSWIPDQDRQVSKLIAQLKGGRPGRAFDFYAQRFLAGLTASIPSDSCLIPCPSRDGGPDHAMAFARSLSKYAGIPILDILKLPGNAGRQKAKTKQERSQRILEIASKADLGNVIFIDDVVTTGATANSAKRALETAVTFQVWALAHRRDLAGADLL
jgi:predicted amidophosphoribosyltransferase